MPSIHGILETALSVADPQRSADFYRRLFHFSTLLEKPDRLIALQVGGGDVLLLFKKGSTTAPSEMPGGTIPPHAGGGQGHLAFSISADEVQAWRERLQAEGVA